MANSAATTPAVLDLEGRSLRLGPFTVQVDAGTLEKSEVGQATWLLPFTSAWFFQACGYLTWDRLAEAFALDAWSGWYRVAGNGIQYGTWVAIDAEAARVLARLADQDLLIEWRPDAIVLTTAEPDGPAATLDLDDLCTVVAAPPAR